MSEARRTDFVPILASILVAIAFVCGGLFHAWLRIERLRLGYAMSQTTSRTRKIIRENERLRLEVATLEAPSRIEQIAREKLHMRAPKVNEVEVLRSSPGEEAKLARSLKARAQSATQPTRGQSDG